MTVIVSSWRFLHAAPEWEPWQTWSSCDSVCPPGGLPPAQERSRLRRCNLDRKCGGSGDQDRETETEDCQNIPEGCRPCKLMMIALKLRGEPNLCRGDDRTNCSLAQI